MKRKSMNWGASRRPKPDKYVLFAAYLWGAKSVLYPGSVTISRNMSPDLRAEFEAGRDIAARGNINLGKDCNPTKFAEQLRRDHEIRRKAIAEEAETKALQPELAL